MGKNKQFKRIRKIAESLPPLSTYGYKIRTVTGKELIDKGIKDIKGTGVESDKTYKVRERCAVPMDHVKNLKRNYYKNGEAGIEHYVKAVHVYVAQQQTNKDAMLT